MPEDRAFRRWNPQVHLTHIQLCQIDNYRNGLQNPLGATSDEGGQAQPPLGYGSTSRGRGRGG
ncbi:hypothetical protein L208DRAFT_1388857 [Tricholoma matsutake]|nr:hypothetical protein L208DRAFT_1388857 [Tricholoma matsutake 945]